MNQHIENTPLFIDDFNYELPDERIAKYPLAKRDTSKLLVYQNDEISESKFHQLADFLPEKSLLIYNNTRVIQARLLFQKESGASVEIFCLEPVSPYDYVLSLGANNSCIWKCMIGNLKKWKNGLLSKKLETGTEMCNFSAERLSSDGNTHTVKFTWDNPDICFADILDNAGELPIPPYLHRRTEESDKTTYQTVYSKIKGSVAAPTAGLHFTPEVFEQLKAKNITTDEVTLHVGAGTFQPVKSDDVHDHPMHTEVISVNRDTIVNIMNNLGNIIAVGTTSVRTLESLYFLGISLAENDAQSTHDERLHISQWRPYEKEHKAEAHAALQSIINYLDAKQQHTLHAETQIMIKPGYSFRIVDGIITNFHQPKSTLLLLVSAFVKGKWKNIYDYALQNEFRFLSYGDSSLLLK